LWRNAAENMTRRLRWVTITLGVLLLGTWSILRMTRPPAAQPASAPDTVFSAGRAMRDVAVIAQRPHPVGSADHDRVRDYIVQRLESLGLRPVLQQDTGVGTRYHRSGRVTNIAALVPGRARDSLVVMLVAHYDGVPAGPAAADDGSGCAILLETARALLAHGPLPQTVLLLFTDSEERGLLGAAAFVHDNPLARRVGIILNFEARGTTGRSYMFETGPGNMDAVRVLATVPDVSAASTFTAVYRALPNDTDLSELAALGRPALNFAFADQVRNYHSPRDDMAHLNPRSVQHQGNMALALALRFANGPLPRPITRDAVFFDLPAIGLVVYPDGWSLPLAIALLFMVLGVAVATPGRTREKARGASIAFGFTIVAVAVAAGIGYAAGELFLWLHHVLPGSANPVWSGLFTGAIAMLSLSLSAACFALGTAGHGLCGGRIGVLGFWASVAVVLSLLLPGAAYLVTWPVLATSAALLVPSTSMVLRTAARWIAAAIVLLLLAGFVYAGAAIMLGNAGAGAVAAAVLSCLGFSLLLPLSGANHAEYSRIALVACAAAGMLVVIGLAVPAR
jgi:hypothetical protein